jgi:predicted dehydrogenase
VSRPRLRVGIVGCGLVGSKRARALGRDVLVGCYDVHPERAKQLAEEVGGEPCATLELLLDLEPDVVVVATVHRDLAPIARQALKAGAHVLVEKPAGMGTGDIDAIAATARRAGRLVKVGFNHRFHPGIARAIEEATSRRHGDVLYVRARYGHGGRLGYEREWRCDPALSGGGELVDQGMHLLDLAYAICGPLPLHSAMLRTQFWSAPVDDNAVLLLGEQGGVGTRSPFALLHVSWTEWKNTFSLEVACERAKLVVDGLAGSYGAQRLRLYRMRPELGPPELEEVRYPERDGSWASEWEHFAVAIAAGDPATLEGDLASARFAWSCVEEARRR